MRLLGVFALSLGLVGADRIRIMPLGDSITEHACWRARLWDRLSGAGLAHAVDFVGSMTTNPLNCTVAVRGPASVSSHPASVPFDLDHEGHWAWNATTIADQWLEGWLESTPADVVMFMLGTNDIFYHYPIDEIFAAYDKMICIMRRSNPQMKIIMDMLLPSIYFNEGMDAVNARIPAFVAEYDTPESPIRIADVSAATGGFTLDMLRDGIHPTPQGDEYMADRIAPILIDYVKDSLRKSPRHLTRKSRGFSF